MCLLIVYFSHAVDTPTLCHLYHFTGQSGKELRIIQQVSYRWQSVAFVMGFDGAEVQRIQQDAPFQTDQACVKVFHQWLTTSDHPTWETLIVKLRLAQFNVLADDLDSELL